MRQGRIVGLVSLLVAVAPTTSSDVAADQAQCDAHAAEIGSRTEVAGRQDNIKPVVLLQRRQAMHERQVETGVSQPLLALLEDNAVSKDNPENDEEPPGPDVLGDKVPLDAVGFKAVMDGPCGFEKELFVGRVIEHLGLAIASGATVHNWMQEVYQAGPQTLDDLKALIKKVSKQQGNKWISLPQPAVNASSLRQADTRDAKIPSLASAVGVAEDWNPQKQRTHSPRGLSLMGLSGERKPAKKKGKKAAAVEEKDETQSGEEDEEVQGNNGENNENSNVVEISEKKKTKPSRNTKEHGAADDAEEGDEEEHEEQNSDLEEEEESAKPALPAQVGKGSPARRTTSKIMESNANEEYEGSSSRSGESAPLSEEGYRAVVKLRSEKQMTAFVKRAIADRGLHVVDAGALAGVVPYYSGAKATQSWKALSTELAKAEKMKKHQWVSAEDVAAYQEEDKEEEEESDEVAPEKERKVPALDALAPTRVKQKMAAAAAAAEGPPPAFDFSNPQRSFVADSTVDVPHHRTAGALMQTQSHSKSTSSAAVAWITSVFALAEGQAMYWLGARVTLVAAAGSLLFGLFLFDESAHHSRAAAMLEADEAHLSTPKPPLSDLRPGSL